jgi:serine/threonine-protein kinase
VLQHPNIVTIFDVGEDDEFLYIALQLVEGSSLQSMIERGAKSPIPSKRRLPASDILPAMAGVLDALEYAHRQNVVHQDVKPGNILIEAATGRAFLVDFGIARTELTEDESKYVHGTPIYMAPEQARGETTDARADIYAAGLSLWEAFAGKLPHQALPAIKLVGIKARKPETFFTSSPSSQCPRIDGELERIIMKAAACDKLSRYGSCAAFKEDLRKYAESKFQIRI